MGNRSILAVLVVGLLALATSGYAASVNVICVVDESGSMSTEHNWIGGMVTSLDARLAALGLSGKYGLVGFGASGTGGHAVAGHKHLVAAGISARPPISPPPQPGWW